MSSMIQVRNVPEALHRRLKSCAASQGLSLSDYILAELRRMAELPTPEEMRQRLRGRAPVSSGETAEAMIRAGRDAE
ncbi:MAG TPA: hypothetical protein VL993_02365 [Stellaceae bacterium]|nr:hypothetical protein [Stellaceae bacterium]